MVHNKKNNPETAPEFKGQKFIFNYYTNMFKQYLTILFSADAVGKLYNPVHISM